MTDASGVERQLLYKAGVEKIPINASFELLPICNMDCDMCYVRLAPEQAKKLGGIRGADEWIRLAEEMKNEGTLFILLTGGEPLLHPEFKRLYTHLRSMGMILTVNTNSTLIDEGWADFFAEAKPRRMNISLYGKDADTYERLCHYGEGFLRVTKAIRLLKDRGVDVKLNYSATRENRDDIDSVLSLCEDLDVPINIETYMYPMIREREDAFNEDVRLSPEEAAELWLKNAIHFMGDEGFEGFRKSMLSAVKEREDGAMAGEEGFSCMATNCSFTVNWQGYMRPCVMLSSPQVNVFEKGFAASWKILREVAESIRISQKCAACRLRPACRICPASALGEGGTTGSVPEYLCRMAEATHQLLKYEK